MQKLFLSVAASLLFVALVILAQALDGAAQGPADPDAVATNLVNTVCASCHTLDRVKFMTLLSVLEELFIFQADFIDQLSVHNDALL
jgi:cytochrome c553